MTDQLSVIETALSVRPQLSEILDASDSEQMCQKIDALLARFQAGESVENDIWDLLTDTRATRKWVTQFSQGSGVQKGPGSLIGNHSDISAPEFKCPKCDYTWTRSRVGAPTPLCPVHNIPLAPI